jgi:hypothetical protein
MEIKHSVIFEVKKGERTYQFFIPNESPVGEVYEVCCSFLEEITGRIRQHVDSLRVKEQEAEKISHPSEEYQSRCCP